MLYSKIQGIDKKVSRLLEGVMWLRGKEDSFIFDALDYMYENGLQSFDTAHVYGEATESLLGRWIQARGNRNEVVILAKGAHHNSDGSRVTPEAISTDMQDSMNRIQTDYLDMYVLHRDDPTLPVGPIVECLNEHVKSGRIGAFGGSNWSYQRIAEANNYAKENNLIPFALSSPCFNMVDQVDEPWENCISIGGESGKESRAWYAKEELPLFCWSSLAGGFLTGEYHRDTPSDSDDNQIKMVMRCYGTEENFERLDRAKELAKEKEATLPQIALSYVLSQNLNTFALIGCANKEQFDDNYKAFEIELSASEIDYLDLKTEKV
ncbi:MAG: aldo/keto reductase [Planctomycetota bacterium]|nr:MAG: aldo/keto reductase [Planctomycetota bacterium]